MALTADIQQQVFDLLSRASNVSFVTADLEPGSISQLTPGQRVSAEVLSMQANNRIQVRVGTERFNLDLPMAVRIGQTLEMTFVSADPRSTFAIARREGAPPPVTLSDASRLLSLLVSPQQMADPQFRSSLQSISSMLRSSSGEAAVLANLLDEALIYGSRSNETKPPPLSRTAMKSSGGGLEQTRLAAFETNAARILGTIAQNSRFTLIEAANHPVTPLPLIPGQEVNATVIGTLSGGRSVVQISGTTLELQLAQKVMPGEILRLTYLSAEPKPVFALPRTIIDGGVPPHLSEAGRWLSVLEHSEGGISRQQSYVLERLNTVLQNLPPGSPAFSAITDEAQTYQRSQRTQPAADLSVAALQQGATQSPAAPGNGIMLSDDMAKLLQAVIKGNRLALLETLNQQSTSGLFMPGQQLRGEVLAALGGGRFTVQVAGQMLEFLMPKGTRRGDMINLFFITEELRQTFLMVRFGRAGDSRVSDTGRWLSAFLSGASTRANTPAALGLLRTLLAGPTSDAPLLGRLLQQGLRESGLFYESHLARWFGGDYPLDEILKEPQGRLSSRLAQTGGSDALPTAELARAGVRSGSTDIIEALFNKVGASMSHEGIADQRSLPIVGEQLSSLQNSQLLFRGDLFPGQHMEWKVAEREAGRNSAGGRERSWETGVTVNLPHLGPVTAQLSLDGTRIAVKLKVERGDSVPVLEAGRGRLVEQLEGAGLTPEEMSIHHVAA